MTFILVLALAIIFSLPATSRASFNSSSYTYFVGTGDLCALDPSACPVISSDSGGDKIEVTGQGTVSGRPRSVTGGGTLVHKNSDGDVVATGTWEAVQLLRLDEYGCGGAGFPDNFCGGRALIRVKFKPEGSSKVYRGYLQVDCVIGDQVAEGAVEGAHLNILGGPNFDTDVSGFTLLIKE